MDEREDFLHGRIEVAIGGQSEPAPVGKRREYAARQCRKDLVQVLLDDVACLLQPSVVLPIEGAPLVFSTDFLEAELRRAASEAHKLGFLQTADVDGIVDPRFSGAEAAMGGTR